MVHTAHRLTDGIRWVLTKQIKLKQCLFTLLHCVGAHFITHQKGAHETFGSIPQVCCWAVCPLQRWNETCALLQHDGVNSPLRKSFRINCSRSCPCREKNWQHGHTELCFATKRVMEPKHTCIWLWNIIVMMPQLHKSVPGQWITAATK